MARCVLCVAGMVGYKFTKFDYHNAMTNLGHVGEKEIARGERVERCRRSEKKR